MHVIKMVLFAACLELLSACATEDRFNMVYGSWVGQPLDKLSKLYGERLEETQDSQGGRAVRIRLKSHGCTIYYGVDSQNLLNRFWHEGTGCKQEPNII